MTDFEIKEPDLGKIKRLKAKIFNKKKWYPDKLDRVIMKRIIQTDGAAKTKFYISRTIGVVFKWFGSKAKETMKYAITTATSTLIKTYGLPLLGFVLMAIIIYILTK